MLIAACSLVGIGGVVFTNRAAIAEQLNDWHVTPQPERLTELFFADYTTLPKSLKAGSTHNVTFTVHNLEHQPITYHYKLVAVLPDSDTEQPLGDGTFSLEHDRSHVSQTDVVVPALGPRIGVKVNLYYTGHAPDNTPMQSQSINYWVFITDGKAQP